MIYWYYLDSSQGRFGPFGHMHSIGKLKLFCKKHGLDKHFNVVEAE